MGLGDIHQYVVLSIFEDKIVVSSSKLDGIVVESFFWMILLILLLNFHFSNCFLTFMNFYLFLSNIILLETVPYADIFCSRLEGTNDTILAHLNFIDGTTQ